MLALLCSMACRGRNTGCGNDVTLMFKAKLSIRERERDRFVNRHVHVRGSLVDNSSGWMLSSDCAMAKSEWPDL
jgi:hypothetical protein